MSYCRCAVLCTLFICVAFSTFAVTQTKKTGAQQQQINQQQKVAEAEKLQQNVAEAEQVLQHTKQLQQEEQKESPTAQCTPKLRKPKSLKALAEYELCKQECRRKRDQESTNEYIDYLKEELRIAEERADAEALQQQQQQQMGF